MKGTDAERYDITARSDHVEIRGVSRRRVVEALDLLERVRAVQADHAAATRDELVHTLMAGNVPLIPPATVTQAQRLAGHRDALLATPLYTHGSLCELRGDARESSTRTWLSRRKAEGKVFTVTHSGRTPRSRRFSSTTEVSRARSCSQYWPHCRVPGCGAGRCGRG